LSLKIVLFKDNLPLRWLQLRSRPITRPDMMLHVTPSHRQQSSVPSFHDSVLEENEEQRGHLADWAEVSRTSEFLNCNKAELSWGLHNEWVYEGKWLRNKNKWKVK
jgi:hypothetical protein